MARVMRWVHRLLPRPRQIERRLRAATGDLGGEQADVFVVAPRILHRQRRLFLKYDVVPRLLRKTLLGDAGIPVALETRPAGEDQVEFDARRMFDRCREIRQQARRWLR